MGELVAPQGHVGLIVEPSSQLNLGDPYKAKCIGIHWEMMFARARFKTADMIEQHRILARTASLIDAGALRTTLTETLAPIDAANLREAHRRLESGSTIGKLALAGPFDGAEGWLAHANRFGNAQLPVLFVKSFVDAPDESLPDNQAEIQIWTSGTADPKLIEVEEQGALQVLAPGASLTWTVHWSACELPSSSLLAAGNADLAALARAHAVKH
jgi:hypothetical protein